MSRFAVAMCAYGAISIETIQAMCTRVMMTDSVIKHVGKAPYTSDDPAVAQNVWTDGDRFLKGTVQNSQQHTDKKGGVLNTEGQASTPGYYDSPEGKWSILFEITNNPQLDLKGPHKYKLNVAMCNGRDLPDIAKHIREIIKSTMQTTPFKILC
jgi:hypothetical protein